MSADAERGVKALLEFRCPRCGKRNDQASGAGHDEQPNAGDIALCIACGAPLELRAAMPPKWLTWDEVKALPAESRAAIWPALLGIVTLRPALTDRYDERRARADAAMLLLQRGGWRYCDIPACNCGSWHAPSSAEPR